MAKFCVPSLEFVSPLTRNNYRARTVPDAEMRPYSYVARRTYKCALLCHPKNHALVWEFLQAGGFGEKWRLWDAARGASLVYIRAWSGARRGCNLSR